MGMKQFDCDLWLVVKEETARQKQEVGTPCSVQPAFHRSRSSPAREIVSSSSSDSLPEWENGCILHGKI